MELITKIELIINLIANICIVIGMTLFIIGVFGKKSEMLESIHPIESFLLKFGLCAVTAGSLFNILTLSTPNTSEISLNVGLGLTFLWAAHFHWKYIVNKNK